MLKLVEPSSEDSGEGTVSVRCVVDDARERERCFSRLGGVTRELALRHPRRDSRLACFRPKCGSSCDVWTRATGPT